MAVHIVDGRHVSPGQVHNMDIVPNTGAVRSGIVGAEDGNALPLALSRLEHQRDQMGFGGMVLTDESARRGARGIEVPQGYIFQAIGGMAPVHQPLHRQFGLPVGVGGGLGAVLHNGSDLWLPIDCRRAGKDDLLHIMALHGPQQCHGGTEVVFIVEQRVLHALPHLAGCRKVQHRLNGMLRKDLVHKRRIGNIPHIEGCIPYRSPVAPGEVIHNNAVKPGLTQSLQTVAAHISGAAAYQNCHLFQLLLIRQISSFSIAGSVSRFKGICENPAKSKNSPAHQNAGEF